MPLSGHSSWEGLTVSVRSSRQRAGTSYRLTLSSQGHIPDSWLLETAGAHIFTG